MADADSRTKAPRGRRGGSAASSPSAIEKLAEARFLIDEEAPNSADAIAYVHACSARSACLEHRRASVPRPVQTAARR